MQNIRRATKKHRKVLTAIIVLLILGLLSSFAIWSSASINNNNAADMSTDDYITAYEGAIANLDDSDLDYSRAQEVAQYYIDLSSLYWTKLEEVEEAEQAEWRTKAIAASKQAEEYYAQAYAMMPEELNDDAKVTFMINYAGTREGQLDYEGALELLFEAEEIQPENAPLQAAIAGMYTYSDDMLNVMTRYIMARELAPENMTIVNQFAAYLFSNVSIEMALEEWDTYIDNLGEDHDYYEAAVERRDYYAMLASFFTAPDEDLDGDGEPDANDGQEPDDDAGNGEEAAE